MSKALPNRPLNPRRIGVLAINTFTQLVRMKVFYFLAIFGVVLIAAQSLDLPTSSAPENAGLQILYSIKNASFGCMQLFSLVLAVVATGLLLPKDIEDRTLYTILAKPVPRLDYLLGKFFGVTSLIFVTLAVMDLLMVGVLSFRTSEIVEMRSAFADRSGFTPEMKESYVGETRALGPTWSLQAGVLILFFKSMVMAAVALLLSTFSTSTLFTAVVGFMVLFIGFFQADAREYYFSDAGLLGKIGSGAMTVALPDFQLFNLTDSILEGKVIKVADLLKVTGVTAFYCITYIFTSWIVFARKEF
ncbi:MAG: ABC transporter permease subunit [Verrucomicrobiota bacterium]